MGAPSRKAVHASFRAAVIVASALVVWQYAATALAPAAKEARELGVDVRYADAVAELGKRLANRSFSHRFRHPLMLLRFLTCTTTLEEAEAMLVACEPKPFSPAGRLRSAGQEGSFADRMTMVMADLRGVGRVVSRSGLVEAFAEVTSGRACS
ncbi:SEC14 [Symbiodinium sp. CCMP2592]|nr:SEC14 [Symbiodinium sp. CCMP2592]